MKIMRKLILGAVSTGFVAIALAATTFAWYKLGNAAFAEEFEFNASTTDGFLVSVDGNNFKHKLTTNDMIKAMIVGKNPNDYEFAEDGKLIDKRNGNIKLNDSGLQDAYLKALALEPVTSYDGKVMKGLSGGVINEANDYSTKYVYFNLYFKTVAETEEENKTYQIYLDGLGNEGNTKVDAHNNVYKTEVWSDKATNVKLAAPMTVWDATAEDHKITYAKGDTVKVYTANASRLSAQNLGYLQKYQMVDSDAPFNSEETYYTRGGLGTEESPYIYTLAEITEFEEGTIYYTEIEDVNVGVSDKPKGNALIYELSSNSAYDLGSFATNYNGDDPVLNRLYNCNYNAMYTYYNNVKTEDKLDSRLPNYSTDLPSTIRSLVNEDGENRKDVIATIKSGLITKVGFRFWIEGWDGDCFDGLPGYYDNTYEEYTGEYDEEATYYTRSGDGTEESPYVYTRALIDGFNPNTTYYVISGIEEKEVNPINARLLFNSIKVD